MCAPPPIASPTSRARAATARNGSNTTEPAARPRVRDELADVRVARIQAVADEHVAVERPARADGRHDLVGELEQPPHGRRLFEAVEADEAPGDLHDRLADHGHEIDVER